MALISEGISVLANAYMYGKNEVYLDEIDMIHLNSALRATAGGSTFPTETMKFSHNGRARIELNEMKQHIGSNEWSTLSYDDLERVRYYLDLVAFIDCQGEFVE